jgi:cellulose synthase/poly-beta-1,6-N-acetylglucosamine synthase-like glycosyltransferase
VDDGSKDLTNYEKALALARIHPNLVVLRQEKNQGKRHAQALAFRIAKADVLVTVDSDTVLEKGALMELVKPFIDPRIGAVTGQLSLLNKSDNILTRILNIRYIVAGVLERAAYSYFGVVNCTSGPMSAYRKSLVLQNLEDYLNQTHLGKKCTFGDDRRLTVFILRNGYSVFFQKTAKAKTVAPNTFKSFSTQQLRWNRSFWRESCLSFRWIWKRSVYLTAGTILDMSLPFLYFGSLLWTMSVSFTSCALFLLFPLFITMPLMAFVRNFDYMRLTKAKDYALVPLYSWMYLVVLLPITFFALFTTSQTGWGTR